MNADQLTIHGSAGAKVNNCCPAQYDQHNNVSPGAYSNIMKHAQRS